MITLIAAIGPNGELGKDNKLLWNIPEDMKHFKSYTMGKTIIMGAKTFASIGYKPLPGRKNIVVTSQNLTCVVAIRAHNIDEALSIEHCYDELVVIGGASIYDQTIDRASKLVITYVDGEFDADVYFPAIDLTKWKINSTIEGHNEKYNFRFVEYLRHENSGVPN